MKVIDYLKHQHCQARLSKYILNYIYYIIAQIIEKYVGLKNFAVNKNQQTDANYNIPNISHTFICEGKEKTNTKIVISSRPTVYPAPQSSTNCE